MYDERKLLKKSIGEFFYLFNKEGRLVCAERKDKVKVVFSYDTQGRLLTVLIYTLRSKKRRQTYKRGRITGK